MKLSSPDTLVAIMAREGYTLGRLAAEVGCSKPFIAHLRAGRKRGCTPALAKRISEVLNSTVIFLPEMTSAAGQSAKRHMATSAESAA